MAGADEDAGLSCGPAGPRVQRAGALLTPGGAGKAAATCVFIPSSQSTRMCVPCPLVWLASHSTNTPSPNHCEAVSPKALIRGADTLGRAHTHQHACTHTRVHAHAQGRAHMRTGPPEAAAVVQPPVRQVALHEVHVLPTDAAAAAEGAPRGLALGGGRR